LFAAASNDGANLRRAFPATEAKVFCIHSTDGHGNPSGFNPTASSDDANFSLLGEHVESCWPAGVNGHEGQVRIRSGTSVATPIAAGLAASVLSFVQQLDRPVAPGDEMLGDWLKKHEHMRAVLRSITRKRGKYDYIRLDALFDGESTKASVYDKISGIRKNLYK
jgi:hypothetical protein